MAWACWTPPEGTTSKPSRTEVLGRVGLWDSWTNATPKREPEMTLVKNRLKWPHDVLREPHCPWPSTSLWLKELPLASAEQGLVSRSLSRPGPTLRGQGRCTQEQLLKEDGSQGPLGAQSLG